MCISNLRILKCTKCNYNSHHLSTMECVILKICKNIEIKILYLVNICCMLCLKKFPLMDPRRRSSKLHNDLFAKFL